MKDITINSDVTISGGAAVQGRIDQYELIRPLGGGGFGVVFLARDTVAGIEVAVKGLPPVVKNNIEELERIRKNFALVSKLHHPHVAAALHLHLAREVHYEAETAKESLRIASGDTLMVMEYAPGVTLAQWRRQFPDEKVPKDLAVDIIHQLAEALDYAHSQKIVHRDIKPSNVMVETKTDGSVFARLLDFGLAAEIRSSLSRVSQERGDTSGTRPYMAPEQWEGRRQGPATDQYSLAVLFYELVTGEVPFASVFETGDPIVMMNTVLSRKPDMSATELHGCANALKIALGKPCEKRFGTCLEFASSLTRCGRGWIKLLASIVTVMLIATGLMFWIQDGEGTCENLLRNKVTTISWKIYSLDYYNKPLTERLKTKDANGYVCENIPELINLDPAKCSSGISENEDEYYAALTNIVAKIDAGDWSSAWLQLCESDDENPVIWYARGLASEFGEGGSPVDIEQALWWYRKAIERHSPDALYNLGLHYEFGYGVERDDVFAAGCYQLAAKVGDKEAGLRWMGLKKKNSHLTGEEYLGIMRADPWPDQTAVGRFSGFRDKLGRLKYVPCDKIIDFVAANNGRFENTSIP